LDILREFTLTEYEQDIAYVVFCFGLMGFVFSLYLQLIGDTLFSLLILAIAGLMFVLSGADLVGEHFGPMEDPYY
jgi:hypothetical protein